MRSEWSLYGSWLIYHPSRFSDGEPEQRDAVLSYMEQAAERQDGKVTPANMRAPDCPPL